MTPPTTQFALQKTISLACLTLCTAALSPLTLAQVSTTTSTTEAAAAGVNPMTGRPLSEEELHRQLNKSKLVTQLGQEQVKQAQNAADLSLATLRQEAERFRLRNESMAQSQSGTGGPRAGERVVTTLKPLPIPSQMPAANLPAAPGNSGSSGYALPPIGSGVQTQPLAKASGTIQIGGETLSVTAHPGTETAQVNWVDSQVKQVARAGSPLQPIQVQPATGVLGIPAIPGIVPPQGQ